MPNIPSIRTTLDMAGASIAFMDALALMGADLSARLPIVGAGPEPSAIVAGLIQVGKHVHDNNKIQAIKALRDLFNLSLKESKDIIDAFIPPIPY